MLIYKLQKNMELQFYVFLLIHHMQLLNMQWQFYKKQTVVYTKLIQKLKIINFALSGLLGLDLHNKVAGIMGTGKIGQCMARICKGYGMTVLGWDAYPNQALVDEGLLTYVSKEELLKRADLISLHCPLIMGDNGTYHLINDETIALMKDTVYVS